MTLVHAAAYVEGVGFGIAVGSIFWEPYAMPVAIGLMVVGYLMDVRGRRQESDD